MKASTKMCLVNIVALVAFVTSLGGVLAADPTTPMYVGFSLSLSRPCLDFCYSRFKGKLLIQNILDNSMSPPQKKKSSHPILTCYHSAKCITAASNSDGAPVTLQGCTGAESQLWEFQDGAVKVFGNKCLDVTDGNASNGNNLQIWSCVDQSTNQLWDYDIVSWFPSFVCDLPLTLWVRSFSGDIVSSGRTVTSVLIFLREALPMELAYVAFFLQTLIIILFS